MERKEMPTDKYLKSLERISEILQNPDLCAEAMVSEIGEIISEYDFTEVSRNPEVWYDAIIN